MTRRFPRLAPLAAAVALAAACTAPRAARAPDAAPADFQVSYGWSTGALPPQYVYGYTVRLGPGSGGRLDFRPSYDTTTWTASFPVSAGQLDSLYALFRARGVFEREWLQGTPMAGGTAEGLEATAGGRTVRLPDPPAEADRAAVRELYGAVEALVPAGLVSGMVERRQREARGEDSSPVR
jgi:hypothetical protein